MIKIFTDMDTVEVSHLNGFFQSWVRPMNKLDLYQCLRKADQVLLAKDGEEVVGIALVKIIDGIKFPYFVEVLSSYQNQGLATGLLSQL